jgi:hypothetical protein
MWMVRIVVLSMVSLALASCAVPEFPAADSSTSDAPPAESTSCEDQNDVFCSSGGCDRICHMKNVARRGTFSRCDEPVVSHGMRLDNCEDHNVCLEPTPNTSQGFVCFALCRNETGCAMGVACSDRTLSGATSIRVCDPEYKSCEGNCCDPTDNTRNSCEFSRPCYLVPALKINSSTSWTVCEYSGGGGRKGDSCTLARDCMEGLTCVGATNGIKNSGTCLVVCDPSKTDACGKDGPSCQSFPKQWGYCP